MINFNCHCNHCKLNTYVWNIANAMIWIEIPRNGSFSIRHIMYSAGEAVHYSHFDDIMNFSNGTVVLRNPIERFQSLLFNYFIPYKPLAGQKNNRYHIGSEWMGKTKADIFNVCDIVLSDFDRLKDIGEVHHFNSQCSFIPEQFYQIKNIDFINLNELQISNLNSSPSEQIVISNKNKKMIEELYHEDVVLYNERILGK